MNPTAAYGSTLKIKPTNTTTVTRDTAPNKRSRRRHVPEAKLVQPEGQRYSKEMDLRVSNQACRFPENFGEFDRSVDDTDGIPR
jgi:hypothetical protein